MKKASLFTSDRCAGFTTKLTGGCEMFQGSLINRLARSVASLVLVAAIGHLTAAGVEVHAAAGPSHQDILTSLSAVHSSLGAVHSSLGDVQTSLGAVQATINSIETKVDNIKAKVDLIPPAWSQILPAADRFQLVLGGAGVLDKETGLVWEKSPDTGLRTWANAHVHCYPRIVGGRKGWRVPTIEELASLVDPNNPTGPILPPGHPFSNVQVVDRYWSATTSASAPSHAWVVIFDIGEVVTDDKTGTNFVWCARGGQGIDGVQ